MANDQTPNVLDLEDEEHEYIAPCSPNTPAPSLAMTALLSLWAALATHIGCVARLMEIESRLLPCGLHVVGEPPSAMEAIATLVNIAEIDRPDLEKPIRGLPGILARSIRRNVEQIYQANNKVSHSTHTSFAS